MAKDGTKFKHPVEPHDADLVVVEVVFPKMVREGGKDYPPGGTLTLKRGHALAQNKPGRPVYRVLHTVKYAKDPNPEARYEEQPEDGPLVIS